MSHTLRPGRQHRQMDAAQRSGRSFLLSSTCLSCRPQAQEDTGHFGQGQIDGETLARSSMSTSCNISSAVQGGRAAGGMFCVTDSYLNVLDFLQGRFCTNNAANACCCCRCTATIRTFCSIPSLTHMSHGRRQHCSAYIKKTTCIAPSRRAQCTRGGNIQPVHARLDRGDLDDAERHLQQLICLDNLKVVM